MQSRRKRQIEARRRIAEEHNLDGVLDRMERVRLFAESAPDTIEKLDQEFSRLTGLNKIDCTFLFFATALQVVRWILQESLAKEEQERPEHDDKDIKAEEKASENEFKDKHKDDNVEKGKYKDWKRIISEGVPYDIINGSKDVLEKGLNGKDHRLRTLGHDPYLGWVFGTANIMTDTCTTALEGSWKIIKGDDGKRRFGALTSIGNIFTDVYNSTKEDKIRLAAAVCKQGIHIQSDINTIQGLPIPFLETIWPALQERLYKGGYDYLDFKQDLSCLGIVAKQAAYATLINFIIAVVHDFFYDAKSFPNHDLYEVKTRKVLLYSNLIASASNLIYVAVTQAMGKPDAWKKIDFGGLAVTIYRLFSDLNFIYRVKEEFITENFIKALSDAANAPLERFESISPDDFVQINDNIWRKK